MRIAYDVSALRPPRTGVGHYTAALLDHLAAIDQDIEFKLFSLTVRGDRLDDLLPGKEKEPQSRLSQSRLGVPRLAATLVPRFFKRSALAAWALAGRPAGERLVGEVDVVHGTNFWLPPLSKRNGVVTIHDLTFWRYPEYCTPAVRRYRLTIPRILDRCAHVITPTETVRQELAQDLGFPEDRITATHLGVRGVFKGAPRDPNLEGEMGVKGPYILFAGTQEPRKNLDRLIMSMQLLEDVDCSLVVAGPEGWGSVDLPAVALKLGLEHRVIFPGYLEESTLASLVAGASAFVYPSIYEGFGMPPLEAMAAGVPVVAAQISALMEVLGDAPIWCDPNDSSSIAEAIKTALTNESERARSIEAGTARVALYDWRQTASKTLEVYTSVAD